MSKLSGRVALVTGASKGIGTAIALALAEEGAAVAVNYASDKAGADRAVAAITAKGGRAVAVQGSVADASARIVAETVAAFGHIDILVNNAGVYAFAPLEAVTAEDFHRQFNTNVLGLLLTTKEAVAHFPEQGGSVTNISSVVSRFTPPASVVYGATKGAVDVITATLAKELGPKHIRVNAINPGVVNTEGARAIGVIDGEFEAMAVAQTPLGRTGQPDDIAAVAVFLASDDSRWVSGETIITAGGFR
ncbi:glucose 1-dehydrogenase [Acidisoma cellulosilytica]|uniref:Glucose 1-dehydrogenase n=1 Tax=Acidisoma cellulosilyticum TaxID=2802395 RepID=A0A963Z5V5_9PROT|nr:glucose 1-dehydrogenase [Acidisoma cellulosilyticum]MCB8883414.1 glucose 1-dehydrogenase [Acidisoma cellulosilyticum]